MEQSTPTNYERRRLAYKGMKTVMENNNIENDDLPNVDTSAYANATAKSADYLRQYYNIDSDGSINNEFSISCLDASGQLTSTPISFKRKTKEPTDDELSKLPATKRFKRDEKTGNLLDPQGHPVLPARLKITKDETKNVIQVAPNLLEIPVRQTSLSTSLTDIDILRPTTSTWNSMDIDNADKDL
ncbi:hypothetical protein ACF0H5_006580 [Mactra antiquata]